MGSTPNGSEQEPLIMLVSHVVGRPIVLLVAISALPSVHFFQENAHSLRSDDNRVSHIRYHGPALDGARHPLRLLRCLHCQVCPLCGAAKGA